MGFIYILIYTHFTNLTWVLSFVIQEWFCSIIIQKKYQKTPKYDLGMAQRINRTWEDTIHVILRLLTNEAAPMTSHWWVLRR